MIGSTVNRKKAIEFASLLRLNSKRKFQKLSGKLFDFIRAADELDAWVDCPEEISSDIAASPACSTATKKETRPCPSLATDSPHLFSISCSNDRWSIVSPNGPVGHQETTYNMKCETCQDSNENGASAFSTRIVSINDIQETHRVTFIREALKIQERRGVSMRWEDGTPVDIPINA